MSALLVISEMCPETVSIYDSIQRFNSRTPGHPHFLYDLIVMSHGRHGVAMV